jgi:hypothetical protein
MVGIEPDDVVIGGWGMDNVGKPWADATVQAPSHHPQRAARSIHGAHRNPLRADGQAIVNMQSGSSLSPPRPTRHAIGGESPLHRNNEGQLIGESERTISLPPVIPAGQTVALREPNRSFWWYRVCG